MRQHLIRSATFAIAASLVATGAQARIAKVCLDLPRGASTVTAKISSGCLPTHPQYKDAFNITVDPQTATINLTGGFEQIGNSRIGSADCMGSRTVEYSADAAGARRYSVIINSRYAGVLDASEAVTGTRGASECFAGNGRARGKGYDSPQRYSKRQFRDWIRRSGNPGVKTKSAAITGETLGDVAARLLGNHPEGTEGRQSAEITITPALWQREPAAKLTDRRFTAIQIEAHGFLDDSTSGQRIFASARQDARTGKWRTTNVWQQFMCRRGALAGQWSGKPCL